MSGEPEPAGPACRRVGLVVNEDALQRFAPIIRLLTVGLIDESIMVTVIGPSSEPLAEVEWGPVRRIEHGSLRWPYRRQTIRRIGWAIGEEQPGVLHGLAGSCEVLTKELAGSLAIPAVLSLTSMQEIASASVGAAAVVRRWVTPSEVLEQRAREHFAPAADRLSRVPLGLVAEQQPGCFAEQHTNPILVCQNPQADPAGTLNLLQAVRGLIAQYPDLMLLVRGQGRHEAVLRRELLALGLREAVTFVAGPETQDVFRLADIFVDPAADDAMQIPGLQAMARGLAVVAAQGGVADHYHHQSTALTYPPAAGELLGEHLARLLGDHRFARELAAQGQAFVREHRKASQMAGQLAEIYNELASSPREQAA